MAKYRIEIKKSAQKELKKLQKQDLKKILQKIASLAINPRPIGCKKLSSREQYRLRYGNYRILYSIRDEVLIVYIVKVAHRRDVYE